MKKLSKEEIEILLRLCENYIDNGVGWINGDEKEVKEIIIKLEESR